MRRLALVLVLAVAAAAAVGVFSQQAGAAKLSCGKAPLAEVKAVLGIRLTSAQTEATGATPGLTACVYGSSANGQAVTITFRTPGKASFAAAQKMAQSYAKSVSGIGDKAFYNSAGNTATNGAVYVLKRNTELAITAFAPLAKVEALARKIAATL